jgi:transposase
LGIGSSDAVAGLEQWPAIKQVCVQFIELCRQMGLLATASIAIDGSNTSPQEV